LLVSIVVLAVLYARVDVRALGGALGRCHPWWLALGLGILVPIKLLQAWRLRTLMPAESSLSRAESLRLILGADVLNVVMPSKMGDIAKAWLMRRAGHLDGALALALVVLEKALDVLALLAWCALGLLIATTKGEALWLLTGGVVSALLAGCLLLGSARFASFAFAVAARAVPRRLHVRLERLRAAWALIHGELRRDPARLGAVASQSVGLWLVHFLQLWLFVLALHAHVPFADHVGRAALAILAGLVPFTLAGIGPRDAALVALYAPWMAPPAAAALGMLFTSRYVLPALAGLPLLRRYLEVARQAPGAESLPNWGDGSRSADG
jgi:glycosyltransferase 2 family protein